MNKVDNKILDGLIDAFEKAEKHKCPKSAHGELLIFDAVPEQQFYGEIASCLKELRNKREVQDEERWIKYCYQNFICSKCGYIAADTDVDEYKYCPKCGAKMEVKNGK